MIDGTTDGMRVGFKLGVWDGSCVGLEDGCVGKNVGASVGDVGACENVGR
jgi:hypothetical protein